MKSPTARVVASIGSLNFTVKLMAPWAGRVGSTCPAAWLTVTVGGVQSATTGGLPVKEPWTKLPAQATLITPALEIVLP